MTIPRENYATVRPSGRVNENYIDTGYLKLQSLQGGYGFFLINGERQKMMVNGHLMGLTAVIFVVI
jgi:hypothetical protein